MDSFGVGPMPLSGWVPTLSRDWSPLGEDSDRNLRGLLFLSSSIKVHAGRDRAVYALTVRLRPAAAPPISESTPHREEHLLVSRTRGAMLFVGEERPGSPVSAELAANIPTEQFDALWDGVQASWPLQVSATLKNTSYGEAIKLTDGHATRQVLDLRVRVYSDEALPEDWVAPRVARQLQDGLSDVHLDTHIGSGQMRMVVQELTESIAGSAPLSAHEGFMPAIRELVSGLRPAFRAPLNLQAGSLTDAHYLEPAAFKEAVAQHRPQDAQKLLAGYDTLWQHFNVANVVATGESKAGATPAGFRPVVEDLEQVAAQLLAQPRMSSPTLEWALVDAFIYAECIAFAQVAYSGQTVLGIPVAGELKGNEPTKLAFKSLA